MHAYTSVHEAVLDILRMIGPLIASYVAYRRASEALHKARSVEANCSYPVCGHKCHAPDFNLFSAKRPE